MKKFLTTFALFFMLIIYAQQQELFDNDWYLTKIVVDGETFPTPASDTHAVFGDEISIEYLTEVSEGGIISTTGCNSIDIEFNDLNDDSFTVVAVGVTLMDCMYPLYDEH